jgi:mannose-1-phosphate guanylyltransferase
MNYAVIMAGGSGQRLWPLSRKNRPKQILELFGKHSLLQLCVQRARGIFPEDHIIIVTNAEYADAVHKHLPDIPKDNVFGEPVGRDTSNAIGLAATVLHRKNPDTVMAVFSADQIIEPVAPLHHAVRLAIQFLKDHPQALFTFGIKPTFAHTGFGYLKRGARVKGTPEGVYPVEAFKEKPNKSTARKYFRSRDYCWNSGMFVWRADTILDHLKRFLPANAERLERIGQAWAGPHRRKVLESEFEHLEKISIDYGVMERAQQVYMCELNCHWVDIGSYQALAESIGKKDVDDNISLEKTACEWIDSANNIAITDDAKHLITAIHVEDLIIVHTGDATLICHREETEQLKKLLERMKQNAHERFI